MQPEEIFFKGPTKNQAFVMAKALLSEASVAVGAHLVWLPLYNFSPLYFRDHATHLPVQVMLVSQWAVPAAITKRKNKKPSISFGTDQRIAPKGMNTKRPCVRWCESK